MSLLRYKRFWMALASAVAFPAGFVAAQDTHAKSPMPPAHSPISYFRELLEMNPSERQAALANRSPDNRQLVLAKIHEYELLKPEERKLRLQVTELHFYLLQLLPTPATNRAAQLQFIPPETRKLVEDRLREWDNLSEELRQRVLENEATIRYFTDRAVQMPPRPGQPTPKAPTIDSEKLEQNIQRWQALSLEDRRSTLEHFREMFELRPEEKTNVLATLSEEERREIQKTLESFGKLSAPQRIQCLRSFEKFTSLSPEDRRRFLQDASGWEIMSPSERQTLRDLVYNLSRQPFPPGFGNPPKPPPVPRPGFSSVMATNTN